MTVEEQVRQLRQIQHLALIRDEDQSVGSREKADELEAKMSALIAELDEEALALYKRVSSKNKIFMSPLSRGNCSACGLKLPTSVMQHVIAKDRPVVCSGCGRIMYIPEVKATGLRLAGLDNKYLLSRFSTPKLVVNELKAKTRDEAIAELCNYLAKEGFITDQLAVVESALEREAILTTAVGNGLAFPHMRGVEEGVLTFAAGASADGIDWGGEKVHLVFFTVLPVVASPFYLKLMAALAKSFEDGERLPFVLATPDNKTFWKELNKATRVAIKNM